MFTTNGKKAKKRYPGYDVNPWRVITYSGVELGRFENYKNEKTREVKRVYATRWHLYSAASAAAKALGGVAVRA